MPLHHRTEHGAKSAVSLCVLDLLFFKRLEAES